MDAAATPHDKPHATIFYSWQSDLPNSTNRGFIENCLSKAIKELGREGGLDVVPRLDKDVEDQPGSPEITRTILRKIRDCKVFVGDVSIINASDQSSGGGGPTRLTPNPNVLLECGYAMRKLQFGQTILVVNSAFGRVEQLPFDLRGRKVLTYSLAAGDDKVQASKELTSKLKRSLAKILAIDELPKSAMASIQFADPVSEDLLGDELAVTIKPISGFDIASLPDYGRQHELVALRNDNRHFYREFGEFATARRSTKRLRIGVTNNGRSLLSGVRLEIAVSADSGEVVLLEPTEMPDTNIFASVGGAMRGRKHDGVIEIKKRSGGTLLVVELGKVRIGETAFSDMFLLGSSQSGQVVLDGKMFCEETMPQSFSLTLRTTVEITTMDNVGFMQFTRDFLRDNSQ